MSIGSLIHKAKDTINSASHEAKDTINSVNHWSKDFLHKTANFTQKLADIVLEVKDFLHSIPMLEDMANQPIPRLNMSTFELLDLTHEGLLKLKRTITILEKGSQELDEILQGDPNLETKIGNLDARWKNAEPKIKDAFKSYDNDQNETKLATTLKKYVPLIREGKNISQKLIGKIEN